MTDTPLVYGLDIETDTSSTGSTRRGPGAGGGHRPAGETVLADRDEAALLDRPRRMAPAIDPGVLVTGRRGTSSCRSSASPPASPGRPGSAAARPHSAARRPAAGHEGADRARGTVTPSTWTGVRADVVSRSAVRAQSIGQLSGVPVLTRDSSSAPARPGSIHADVASDAACRQLSERRGSRRRGHRRRAGTPRRPSSSGPTDPPGAPPQEGSLARTAKRADVHLELRRQPSARATTRPSSTRRFAAPERPDDDTVVDAVTWSSRPRHRRRLP